MTAFRLLVFQIILLFLVGAAGIVFVSRGEISSLADDSATYLIMAQYFSAFGNPTAAVESLYHSEGYPSVFPIVLAATGRPTISYAPTTWWR